jgi:hypothetical protein
VTRPPDGLRSLCRQLHAAPHKYQPNATPDLKQAVPHERSVRWHFVSI